MPAQQRNGAFPYPSQRVIVLRHGERRDNHPDAPAESDPPLTQTGIEAVEVAAARLRHYLGEEEARTAILIVSPFLRTKQTAEALQHYGVGIDHAMVVDNSVCEVFGPSRIKTSRAPQLQAPPPTSRTVGNLPAWGETLETATQRYVTNFLRIGDVYGGALSSAASSNPSFSTREESQTSSSLLCPAAVTNRTNNSNNNALNNTNGSSASGATPVTPDSALQSRLRSGRPRTVILVTHGDAISAVLSHFYPARVVYEAEFLSFIIMRRYGAGNHVYHLDESAGVNWFVEGIDSEPQDPILRALELEREAAMARSARETAIRANGGGGGGANVNGPASSALNGNGDDDGFDDDADDVSNDDEGESLDGDADDSAQPSSFAGSRMKSRTSRLPPRRAQPHVAANAAGTPLSMTQDALPPTQTHVPVLPGPQPAAPQNRRSSGVGGGGGSGGATGNGAAPARTPHGGGAHAGGAHAGGTHAGRHHPKAGEGCERIRTPDGTPAQSSNDPVTTTMGDDEPHPGRSSSSISSSSRRSKETLSVDGSVARSVPSDSAQFKRSDHDTHEEGEGSEENAAHVRGSQASSPAAPPLPLSQTRRQSPRSPQEEEASSVPASFVNKKQPEALLRDMSSYGGLTEEGSTNSWVKTMASSASYFSAVAAREGNRSIVGNGAPPQQQPQPEPARESVSVAAPPASPAKVAKDDVASMAAPATTTVLARTSPRHSSAIFTAAVLPTRGIGVSQYGATPQYDASFDDSTTSTHPCAPTAPTVPSETGDHYPTPGVPNIARRIDRHKALSRAAGVSYLLRALCVLLVIIVTICLNGRAAILLFCILGILWELALAAVLMLSCRVNAVRPLRIRRVIEHLRVRRPAGFCAASATNASRGAAAENEEESGDTPFFQFPDGGANGGHYESSIVWQEGSHPQQDDDGAHDASTTDAMAAAHRRSTFEVGVLVARHIAATALKVFALCLAGYLVAVMCDVHALRALHSMAKLFTTPAGLVVTLAYCCVDVVRGVWDETHIDAVIDYYE